MANGLADLNRRWLALFVGALGWLMSVSDGSAQAPTIEEVTTFRKFHGLSNEQALRGRPVRFKGVVLCYDLGWVVHSPRSVMVQVKAPRSPSNRRSIRIRDSR
jgi:hypothetical protein